MDMPWSVCYCLCKPPLTFIVLIFLHRESSLPPSMRPFCTGALSATCHHPSSHPDSSHPGSLVFFAPFLLSLVCVLPKRALLFLYSTLPSQQAIYHQFLNICKPNQSTLEKKKHSLSLCSKLLLPLLPPLSSQFSPNS